MDEMMEIHDARGRDWCWMDGEVLPRFGPTIGAKGVATYLALCFFDSVPGNTRPTTTDIGGVVGMSESEATEALARLETWGLIATEQVEVGDGTVELDYVLLSKREWRDEAAT